MKNLSVIIGIVLLMFAFKGLINVIFAILIIAWAYNLMSYTRE